MSTFSGHLSFTHRLSVHRRAMFIARADLKVGPYRDNYHYVGSYPTFGRSLWSAMTKHSDRKVVIMQQQRGCCTPDIPFLQGGSLRYHCLTIC